MTPDVNSVSVQARPRLMQSQLKKTPAQKNTSTICKNAGFCMCGEAFYGHRLVHSLLVSSLQHFLAPKTVVRKLYEEGRAILRLFPLDDDAVACAEEGRPPKDLWLHVGYVNLSLYTASFTLLRVVDTTQLHDDRLVVKLALNNHSDMLKPFRLGKICGVAVRRLLHQKKLGFEAFCLSDSPLPSYDFPAKLVRAWRLSPQALYDASVVDTPEEQPVRGRKIPLLVPNLGPDPFFGPDPPVVRSGDSSGSSRSGEESSAASSDDDSDDDAFSKTMRTISKAT